MKKHELISALAAIPDDIEIVCNSDEGVYWEPNLRAAPCTLYGMRLTNPVDGKTWKQFYTKQHLAERDRDRETKEGLDVSDLCVVVGVRV